MKIRTAESVAYRAAGVDADLADTLKSGLQAKVRKTLRPEVLGAIGEYGNSIVDDFFVFNGTVRVPASGYLTTVNIHEVTSAWNNNGNTLVLWDCGNCAGNTDEVYLSPFHVVHVAKVPQVEFIEAVPPMGYQAGCIGFDRFALPYHWMMVPQSGINVARAVTVPPSGANKVTFDTNPSSIALPSPASASSSPQNVNVGSFGNRGTTDLQAKLGGSASYASLLKVSVNKRRNVTVAIHKVTDGSLEPMNVPMAMELQDYLNKVFGKQANVFFSVTRADINLHYDIEAPFGYLNDADIVPEVDILRMARDTSVDRNVFFVKSLSSGDAGRTFIGYGVSCIQDYHGSATTLHVVAHEIGHAIGLDQESGEPGNPCDIQGGDLTQRLMYRQVTPVVDPCRLNKCEWDKINNVQNNP